MDNAFAITMDTTTYKTAFFALGRLANPLSDIKILRGRQDNPLLHTEKLMAPGLHNSSDTYHRHLRAQVKYTQELDDGRHQKQWVNKEKEREALVAFTNHVGSGYYLNPFMDGFSSNDKLKVEEQTIQNQKEMDYVRKEQNGMRYRGWSPEDWAKINSAIALEDWEKTEAEMEHSFNTMTTNSSSLFDDDVEDEETDDDQDEYDHLYAFDDVKPVLHINSYEDSTTQHLADIEPNKQSTKTQPTTYIRKDAENPCGSKNPVTGAAIQDHYESKKAFINETFEVPCKQSGDANKKEKLPIKKTNLGYHDSDNKVLGDVQFESTSYQHADIEICFENSDGESEGDQDSEDESSDGDSEDESSDEDSGDESSDESGEDESDEKETATPAKPSLSGQFPAASPLLSSIFDFGDESDDDDDEKNVGENSLGWGGPSTIATSPPSSLCENKSAVFNPEPKEGAEHLSEARQRKANFLSDLLSVRSQVEKDLESDAEYADMEDGREIRQELRDQAKYHLPYAIVSLRLMMDTSGLVAANGQENVLFKPTEIVGAHEVEFKGPLRMELLDMRKMKLGHVIDGAIKILKEGDQWKDLMSKIDFYTEVNERQDELHMVTTSGTFLKNCLKLLSEDAQRSQMWVKETSRRAIQGALEKLKTMDEKMIDY